MNILLCRRSGALRQRKQHQAIVDQIAVENEVRSFGVVCAMSLSNIFDASGGTRCYMVKSIEDGLVVQRRRVSAATNKQILSMMLRSSC